MSSIRATVEKGRRFISVDYRADVTTPGSTWQLDILLSSVVPIVTSGNLGIARQDIYW